MKILALASCFLAASLFLGCASIRPTTDYDFDPSYSFASRARFDLLPIGHLNASGETRRILGDEEFMLRAAKSVLESKEFEYAPESDCDFLVGIRAEFWPPKIKETFSAADRARAGLPVIDEEISTTLVVGGGAINPLWTPDLTLSKSHRGADDEFTGGRLSDDWEVYESGSRYLLWIEVYDADTRHLVWQGHAHSSFSSAFANEEQRLSAVRAILKHFPN